MPMLQRGLALLLIVIVNIGSVATARAQEQGVAAIFSPLEGGTIAGVVPVMGVATHPQFHHYEVAFSYEPNPTDSWFSIGETGVLPVDNERLAVWDTTQIGDGLYAVRLRVFFSEKEFSEVIAHNVHVQNIQPTPTPTVPSTATTIMATAASVAATPTLPLPPPPTPTPFGTQPLIVLPPTATPRPTLSAGLVPRDTSSTNFAFLDAANLLNAFGYGVRLTAIIFLLLGTYAGARALLRHRR